MAAASPAPAASPSASPHNPLSAIGDLFKQHPAASPAAAGTSATTSPKKAAAQAPTGTIAPGGGNGKVWVNGETHVYHKEGSRYYGRTKNGKYMTEAEAMKEGDRPAKEGENATKKHQ